MQKLTKELAKKLMAAKGEARGATLKVDWEHVLQEKGGKGLRKLEAKMAELGYPLKYKEIKAMRFYPIGMDVISMLAIKELFNYDEKKFEEMGGSVVQFSLFLKVLMKYFLSIPTVAKEVSKMWKRHYTIGDMSVSEINEEKKYVILRLENFQIHPIYCPIIRGYLAKVLGMVVKSLATCEETKCAFKGDKYHEYLMKW